MGDGQVIATVIQQDETVVGERRIVRRSWLFAEKTDNVPSDAVGYGGAGDGDVGDVRGDGPTIVGRRTSLRRRTWLGRNRNGPNAACGKLGVESKGP